MKYETHAIEFVIRFRYVYNDKHYDEFFRLIIVITHIEDKRLYTLILLDEDNKLLFVRSVMYSAYVQGTFNRIMRILAREFFMKYAEDLGYIPKKLYLYDSSMQGMYAAYFFK